MCTTIRIVYHIVGSDDVFPRLLALYSFCWPSQGWVQYSGSAKSSFAEHGWGRGARVLCFVRLFTEDS